MQERTELLKRLADGRRYRDVADEIALSIMIVTWNLMGTLPPMESLEKVLSPERLKHELIAIGTQECYRPIYEGLVCTGKENWYGMLDSIVEKYGYARLGTEKLMGLHLIIYGHSKILAYCQYAYSIYLKRGYGGMLGNKGAVGLTLDIGSKRFFFVNCHLNADKNTNKKRNNDLKAILYQLVDRDSYDYIFIFGDLNYRLSLEKYEAFKANPLKRHHALVLKDSLREQEPLADFLTDFTEGTLTFPPTYKIEPFENEYIKSHTPGWTDRIFFRSEAEYTDLLEYYSEQEAYGSDHRPVIACLQTKFSKKKSGYVRLKYTPYCSCSCM